MGLRTLLLLGAVSLFWMPDPGPTTEPAPPPQPVVPASDYFQYPLPTWEPHCGEFGGDGDCATGPFCGPAPLAPSGSTRGWTSRPASSPSWPLPTGSSAATSSTPRFAGGYSSATRPARASCSPSTGTSGLGRASAWEQR